MSNHRFDEERRRAEESHAVQAVVATLFVLGLAGLLFLHADGNKPMPFATPLGTTSDDYLHAPTSDPSLPDVRAAMRNAPDDAVQAPTF